MNGKLNILFLFLFCAFSLFAQKSEKDVEKMARNHFRKKEFVEATPLYLRLLSLEPRNADYNYRYGTCLLFNSDEKKKAFKYLNFAIQRGENIDVEAYYYLGKAYHLTYQFDKAIENYQIYKQKAGSNAQTELHVDRQIEMCKNGKKLMAGVSDIIVLDKRKIDFKSFFRIYNLQDIGGQMIVTEEFQTKQDKKMNHVPLIHFPVNSNRIFYSSYGENGNDLDIYVRYREGKGGWSQPTPVSTSINTKYNENFPYMDPQGEYLYFSSEGHNSMGGYDIFRSKFDPASNTFGTPENLDIPISSPDNDYFYIADSLNRLAYFASQRNSEGDKIEVYNVRVERLPMQMITLKGEFISEISPEEKNISIAVYDEKNKLIGQYKTNELGEYLINLPKKGVYDFEVKVAGNKTPHRTTIDYSNLKNTRPILQTITEVVQNDSEILSINNHYEKPLENEAAILAEAIELKSKLDVNKDLYNIDELDGQKNALKKLDKFGLKNLTAVEIIDRIKIKNENITANQENTQKLIEKTKNLILDNTSSIEKLISMARDSLEKAKVSSTQIEADNSAKNVQELLEQAKLKQIEIEESKEILSYLEQNKKNNSPLLEESSKIKELIEKNAQDEEKIASILLENENFAHTLKEDTKVDPTFKYLTDNNDKLEKLTELTKKQETIFKQQTQIDDKLKLLQKEKETANKKKQEILESEIVQAENLKLDLKNEYNYLESEIKKINVSKNPKKIIALIENTETKDDSIDLSSIDTRNKNLLNELEKIREENEKFALANNIDFSTIETAEERFDGIKREREELSQISENKENANEKHISENNTEKINQEVKIEETESITFQIDPTYEIDIQEIQKQIKIQEKTEADLIARKHLFLERLQNEKKGIEIALQRNPDSFELKTKRKEIEEIENNLIQEIARDEIVAANKNIAEATEDKIVETEEIQTFVPEEILTELDENYSQEILQLQAEYEEGTVEEEILVQRQEKLLNEIEKQKQKTLVILSKNQSDPALQEKLMALYKMESQLNREINSHKTAQESSTSLKLDTDLKALFRSIDPPYEKDIAQLESDNSKNENDKKNSLIDRKKEAVQKVRTAKMHVDFALLPSPDSLELLHKRKNIQTIENIIYDEINELLNIFIAKNSSSILKTKMEEIDKNYSKEIEDLESQVENRTKNKEDLIQRKESLLNQIKLEKSKVNLALISDPESTELLTHKMELELLEKSIFEEIQQSQEKIAEENEKNKLEENFSDNQETTEIEAENATNLLSNQQEVTSTLSENIEKEEKEEEEKGTEFLEISFNQTEFLAKTDPNYEADIRQLNTDLEKGTASLNDIIERKKEYLNNIDKEKEDVLQLLSKYPENDVLQEKIKTIYSLEAQINQEIKELQSEDLAIEKTQLSSSQKNILKSIDSSYEKDISNIEKKIKKGENKNIDLLKRMQESLKKISDEKRHADLTLSTAPDSVELKQYRNEIVQIENKIRQEFNEIIEENLAENADIRYAEIQTKIDSKYKQEIESLENQIQEGRKTEQDVLNRKKDFLDKVKSEKMMTDFALLPNPNVLDLQIKSADLKQIEKQLNEEIKDIVLTIEGKNLAKNLIPEIDPTFVNDIQQITDKQEEISDENKSANLAILERKQQLLEEINAKKESIERQLEQSPKDRELRKMEIAIHQLESDVKKEIEQDLIALEIPVETNLSSHFENLLSEIDNSYLEDVKNLEEEIQTGKTSKQELVKRKYKVLFEIGDVKSEIIKDNGDKQKVNLLTQLENRISNEIKTLEAEIEKSDKLAKNAIINLGNPEQIATSNELFEKRENLNNRLQENPTLTDNKKFNKEKTALEKELYLHENTVLKEAVENLKQDIEIQEESSENSLFDNNSNLTLLKTQATEIELENLFQKAEKTKSIEEKQNLLILAQEKQREALLTIDKEKQKGKTENTLYELLSENKIENLSPKEMMTTLEGLNNEQTEVELQMSQIKNQINTYKAEAAKANWKERDKNNNKTEQLEDIYNLLEQKQLELKNQISSVEKQTKEENQKSISEEAILNELSFMDEVKIAQSEEYKELFKQVKQLNNAQFELKIKSEELDANKEELNQLLSTVENIDNPTKDEQKLISGQLKNIDKTHHEVEELREKVKTQQEVVKNEIRKQPDFQETIENLLMREVAPMAKITTEAKEITGLISSSSDMKVYSDENPIPINVKNPGGLVFRVQIGAFSKPVPNETFNDFSPITGEVVNERLIRYIAGYFGSRETATTARNQIRQMGYSDAFVVAYCDDERIPVYRAMELMTAGICIPTISASESNVILAENAVEYLENRNKKELNELDYNKAPDAVEAEVAETKIGLYYTVQIGVYNKPATKEQLLHVSPLITKRLSNGQIRYSSGIYSSAGEAQVRREEVINLGITDAFITAYYNGNRISLSEAESILDRKGYEILEANNPTTSNQIPAEYKPEKEKQSPFLEDKKTKFIMRSKTEYSYYPSQVINRWNQTGQLFYYDSISRKITSTLLNNNNTNIYSIDADLEYIELYDDTYPILNNSAIKKSEAVANSDLEKLNLYVEISKKDLHSDLFESVLNAPFYKEIKSNKNNLFIHLYSINKPKNKEVLQQIKVSLMRLGASNTIENH